MEGGGDDARAGGRSAGAEPGAVPEGVRRRLGRAGLRARCPGQRNVSSGAVEREVGLWGKRGAARLKACPSERSFLRFRKMNIEAITLREIRMPLVHFFETSFGRTYERRIL